MPWTNANSSMIASYDYDAPMGVLHLRFHSGRIVSYSGVEPQTAAEFSSAPSKGKFFHNKIRDQYQAIA